VFPVASRPVGPVSAEHLDLMELSTDLQRCLLDLARASLRSALSGQEPPPLPDHPELAQPAGCFVSLHETSGHKLRGCVGRLDARTPLAQAVVAMAQAVLEDPRFLTTPVMPDELPGLDIELSILSPLRPAEHPLDFDPNLDGIYLTFGDRSGCFLPQVARETGWSKQQLLDRLCTEKLGLSSMAWKHPGSRLFRFTTLLIGPEPFVSGAAER
jgi:AmmeMemoRadiSam system protein A